MGSRDGEVLESELVLGTAVGANVGSRDGEVLESKSALGTAVGAFVGPVFDSLVG